jgi:aminoglycoside phosphotransferase family enzyme
VVSTQTQIASSKQLALLCHEDIPQQDQNTIEKPRIYAIHDEKRSENARLLFNNKFVFKILQPYKDHRYSLKELPDRHACLIEGWRWNRLFTRGIHIGLARLYNCDLEQDQPSYIELGKFLDPDRDPLDEGAEYVLVMRKLPMPSRLDVLLKNGDDASRQYSADIMTQFLVHIHASLAFQLVDPDENNFWGSREQLKEKLTNNLVSVEKPDIPDKTILRSSKYRQLLAKCESLRETLLPVLTDNKYREFQQYFAQRVKKQQIKRCHGDLKARNIWIMPTPSHQNSERSEIWSGVRVLDAVDFNPEFCNIDTLSDFAMLVADIHARTDSSGLANSMIEGYLRLTKQEDKGSRFVLNYYLIEKAFVGALVSILYDKNLWLGQRYLDVCDGYLTELKQFLPHTHQTALMTTRQEEP